MFPWIAAQNAPIKLAHQNAECCVLGAFHQTENALKILFGIGSASDFGQINILASIDVA